MPEKHYDVILHNLKLHSLSLEKTLIILSYNYIIKPLLNTQVLIYI